jgi:hypothetical protein
MCACKETDVRESPNDSTFAGGERQGSRRETFHPIYGENPVSSVVEHSLSFSPSQHPNRLWGPRRLLNGYKRLFDPGGSGAVGVRR